MLSELRKLNSTLAHRLELAVDDRIHERRLKEASTLLAYLKDPEFLDRRTTATGEPRILPYANRKEITNLARDIHVRLFHNRPAAQTQEATATGGGQDNPEGNPSPLSMSFTSPGDHGGDPPPPKRSRSNEIWAILEKPKSGGTRVPKPTSTSLSTLVLNGIKNDMKFFESRGPSRRPTTLAEIYRALLSVPPTSCEAERGVSFSQMSFNRTRIFRNPLFVYVCLCIYEQSIFRNALLPLMLMDRTFSKCSCN